MAEARDNRGSSLQRTSSATWWPSDFTERFGSISLGSQEETLGLNGPSKNAEHDALPSQTASEVLWSTGMFSGPIPNGFYSVIPDKKLKERFFSIPTLEELQSLGAESARAATILVDFKKDKKLSMLKQLAATLVRGMNSNPAAVIKKIAGLVSDVYKKPNSDSPAKQLLEEASNMLENRAVQMLGQIKQGSCRPRAILFKVLADAVGLDSRLMVGLPNDGGTECEDSYKHMSVMVSLNSVELLVDLMRFPGQLIPRSTKAIFTTHIFPAGESDSAENDSCDSPLEPNSPMYGNPESAEKDDSLFPKTPDSSSNTPGPSRNILMRSTTFVDSRLNVSRSEPNIAATFWRRGRRKAVAELRTASSSPEHPSFHGRRSILSGDKNSNKDCADVTSTSRSDGSSTPETRRIRRRSMSMTPEIGDDIVRAVRAMNETMKQDRLLTEQRDELSGGMSPSYGRDHFVSQKAISLPTSPHEYTSQTSERSRTVPPSHNDGMVSVWNRVLESPMFQNKPLLPYDDWNIDFSEVAVGVRVGIGSFGEVFRGMWNGTEVAIKLFLEQDLTAENMEDFCNEISILSRLRHPNVILFLGACTKPPRLSMITEYMELGSLYYLLHSSGQKNKLSWRRRLKMIRDICRGLMCIHRMKVVHRDLKSANCLVNKHWTVKICDFGLSRIATDLPMRDSSCAGTPEWMAPELIRNEQFTEKCDIFSLGIIMWELCTLSRPWDRIPPERVVYSVANEGSRLEIPDGPLKNLISDCWAEVPNERPSCDEVLSRLLDCEYSLC